MSDDSSAWPKHMFWILKLSLFYVTCCILCWFSMCNYVYSVTLGSIAKRINASGTKCHFSTPAQRPRFHSISLIFVLMLSCSPFRGFLDDCFRSKFSIKFLPYTVFPICHKSCTKLNLLIFNIPQIISLVTDVTLSYTEIHTGKTITASNQS